MRFSATRLAWLLAVVVAGVCAGLVAGCGGSSAPKGATSTVTAAQVTPGPSGKPIPTGSIAPQGSSKTSSAVAESKGSASTSSSTKGSSADSQKSVAETKTTAETSSTSSKPTAPDAVTPSSESGSRAAPEPHPCGLVPLGEAQSITGGEIAGRVEAPLGPTCIYHLSNSKADITMAVESMSFSQVTHQLSSRKPVDIAGRHAFCGKLGNQMLFVPLGSGKLLNVTAPCAIAQQFAARALTRREA
jgi:hypothetical protein